MKLYYTLGLLFLGVVSCRHINDEVNQIDDDKPNKLDDNSEEKWFVDRKSTAKFEKKCKEVGGEAAAKNFLLSLDKTTACLNSQVPKNQNELKKGFEIDSEEDSDSICSKKRKSLHGCFVDIIGAIKDCSREEEKYAPDFIFDAIDGILDFVCADNGKVVNDVINANETDECIGHIIEKAFSGNMTFVCTENFKLLHQDEDNIITKPELCSDLYSAGTCYSTVLTRECPKAIELNNFLVGAFSAILAPCKDVPIIATLPAPVNIPATTKV